MYLRNGDVVDPYWKRPDTTLRLQFTRGEQISYETSAAVDVNRYVIPSDVMSALGTSVAQTGIACFYFASSVMDISSVGVITGMELVNARIEAAKISSTVPSSGLAAIYSEAGVLHSLSELQNYHTTFEPYVNKMRSYCNFFLMFVFTFFPDTVRNAKRRSFFFGRWVNDRSTGSICCLLIVVFLHQSPSGFLPLLSSTIQIYV